MRYYDRMLEERLSYTYGRHGLGGTVPQAPYQPPTSTPSNNIYPTVPSAEHYYGANSSTGTTQIPSHYPSEPHYASYYTQPQTYDKVANYPSTSAEPDTAQYPPPYAQYDGYNVPPQTHPRDEEHQTPHRRPQQPAEPQTSRGYTTSQAGTNTDARPVPSQGPSRNTPTTPSVTSQQPSQWQYPPNAASQYDYPPPPNSVHQQQAASHSYALQPNPSETYVPEPPQSKAIEGNLIDF